MKENIELLNDAIYIDFRKSEFETYATELSMIFHEIDLAIKRVKKWSKNISVKSNLANFPSKNYIIPEPYGNVLIIGAWNYPYQLSILPAVMALAAGNTVIIKPSELSPNTSKAMAQIINNKFDPSILFVAEGGVDETSHLLKFEFNKIFFTGSTKVGKIIMKAASENLTPIVLELGGKSPCFVFNDANIKVAAKRIVWGKFLNSGQTCVAPDYLLVENGIKDKLIKAMILEIKSKFGKDPSSSEAYVNIINTQHFTRLINLIDKDKIIYEGTSDLSKLYIEPTLLNEVTFEDNVMQEEIFGPILPIIEFSSINQIIDKVKLLPKPLALYIFSNSKNNVSRIHSEISFGGGAINDTIMHLTNSNLPFGGVGPSGMGSYHGKVGFETFTHYKSILQKPNFGEPNIKYAPYFT